MTIASEIQRIKTNIANAYDALETAGATMPATENSANLASTVGTISSGGDDVVATNDSSSAVLNGDKVWIEQVNKPASDTITAYSGNLLSVGTSYPVTIYGLDGYGFINSNNTYSVANDLSSATQGGTALNSGASRNYKTVDDYVFVGSYPSGNSPQFYNGSDVITFTQFQSIYGNNGRITGSNGPHFVLSDYSGTRNELKLVDLHTIDLDPIQMETYTGSVNSIMPDGSVYDENTNCIYTLGASYKFILNDADKTYTRVSVTDNSGQSGIVSITSDGKYLIRMVYYDSNPQYQTTNLYVYKIEGTTYTRVTDSVFGSWLTTGCDVFYNPNCDVLTCVNRNNGNYGVFKYTPATETWSEVSVDLSDITTISYFQSPIFINNSNNQLMFKTGDSSGYDSLSNGKVYIANYTSTASGLVWQIKDFYSQDYSNFNIIGSPTISSNGTVSNFSSSNLLKILTDFEPDSSWEFVTKIKMSSLSDTNGIMCSNQDAKGIRVDILANGKVEYLVSDGSSWIDTNHYVGTNTYTTGTVYWLRFGFDTTKYYLDYSTDGTNWTRDVEYSSATKIGKCDEWLGAVYLTSWSYALTGELYLNTTYMNVDSKRYWDPRKLNITQDTFTGIAQTNIAVGSSGDVKTVLPE